MSCNGIDTEEKKGQLRASLRILGDSFASVSALLEAMRVVCPFFLDDRGVFSTDEDFKKEIISAQVLSDILNAAVKATKGDNKDDSLVLCITTYGILGTLIKETPELADAIYAHDGVDFAIMEAMDMHPSFESLVVTSIAFITRVFSIRVPSEALALAFLDKVLAAMEIHHDACEAAFFHCFCDVLCICCTNGYAIPLHAYVSVVRGLWHGIIKLRDDENAQDKGRKLLRALEGLEKAQKMIDLAEMHQAEDNECAGCV